MKGGVKELKRSAAKLAAPMSFGSERVRFRFWNSNRKVSLKPRSNSLHIGTVI
jgi:hypothetical protein